MKQALKSWIPLAVAITAMSGLTYVTAQQIMRQMANDPQVQVAQDVAAILASGKDPRALEQQAKVDIGKSQGQFITVFDNDGKVVASTVQLDGQVPVVPKGSLEASKKTGENRITWMPKKEVRTALIIDRYEGTAPGYVAVGRSLKETESRTERIGKMIALAWLISLLATLIAALLFQRRRRTKTHSEQASETA